MTTYTHLGLEDVTEELRKIEEFRKAQEEIDRTNVKPLKQNMFRAI